MSKTKPKPAPVEEVVENETSAIPVAGETVDEATQEALTPVATPETEAGPIDALATPQAPANPVDLSKFNFGDLDRKQLFRYIYAMILNQTHGRVGAPGIKRWGEMLGVTNYQAQLDLWRQIKDEAMKQIGPPPQIEEIKSPQEE